MLVAAEVVRDVPVVERRGCGHGRAPLHILRIDRARRLATYVLRGAVALAVRQHSDSSMTALAAYDRRRSIGVFGIVPGARAENRRTAGFATGFDRSAIPQRDSLDRRTNLRPMATSLKLAGVAIGDYVTILNAYGREVRGRVVQIHGDGHCTLIAGDSRLPLRADESNTVRVERRGNDR